jgi:hypothetical protein
MKVGGEGAVNGNWEKILNIEYKPITGTFQNSSANALVWYVVFEILYKSGKNYFEKG